MAEHAGKGGVRTPRRKGQAAFGIEGSCSVELGGVLLCGIQSATLLRQDVHQAGARLGLDAFQNHDKLVNVVTVDRSEIPDSQVFKEGTRLHGILRRIFHLQEQVAETASQHAREPGHQTVQVRTHLVIDRVRNDPVQILAEPAHVGGDAHLVIVQDDGHVLLGDARIVQGLVSHTACHGAITDDRHHIVLAVEMVTGHGKAEGRRNGGGGMPRAKAVILAFAAFQESRNAALLAERIEPVVAARQKLVHIGLVAHIPDNLVFGSVKHVMEGNGQFHHPETGRQVPAMLSHLANDGLTNLGRQVIKLLHRTMLDVLWRLYVLQFHYLTRVMMNAAMARRTFVSQERPSKARMDSS